MFKETIYTNEQKKAPDTLLEKVNNNSNLISEQKKMFRGVESGPSMLSLINGKFKHLKAFMSLVAVTGFAYGCNAEDYYNKRPEKSVTEMKIGADSQEAKQRLKEIKDFCVAHNILIKGSFDYLDNLAVDNDNNPLVRFVGDSVVVFTLLNDGEIEYFAANYDNQSGFDVQAKDAEEQIDEMDILRDRAQEVEDVKTNITSLLRLAKNLDRKYEDVEITSFYFSKDKRHMFKVNPKVDGEFVSGYIITLNPNGEFEIDSRFGNYHNAVDELLTIIKRISGYMSGQLREIKDFDGKRPDLPAIGDYSLLDENQKKEILQQVGHYLLNCKIALRRGDIRFDSNDLTKKISWAEDLIMNMSNKYERK